MEFNFNKILDILEKTLTDNDDDDLENTIVFYYSMYIR